MQSSAEGAEAARNKIDKAHKKYGIEKVKPESEYSLKVKCDCGGGETWTEFIIKTELIADRRKGAMISNCLAVIETAKNVNL